MSNLHRQRTGRRKRGRHHRWPRADRREEPVADPRHAQPTLRRDLRALKRLAERVGRGGA
eukprot:1444257-Prymnesium_polylepis.1